MSTTSQTPDSAPGEVLPGQTSPPPATPRKSKKRGLIWVLLLLIIAGIAAYTVWHAGDPVASPQGQGGRGGGGGGRNAPTGPVPVVVSKVGRSSLPVYLNGLGTVTPYQTVTIKSRVDGQLNKVLFNEGDFVQEGQTLLEIDPRPYQNQLNLVQATLARDQSLLANAKVDLKRYQTLAEISAIPTQQLDTQTALVEQYESTIKQDLANIESAKLNVTYSKITAPISGVLGLRLVDPGNIVRAGDAGGLITIYQLQPIAVLFTIPEDNLPQVTKKLRAGAKLPVEAYNRDRSAKLASGTLITIDNQIDSTTGTSKLKAVFDNKDNALFPQQFVNIDVLVDTLHNQLVVPNVAVQHGQQGTFVYVVDDDSIVHLKTVQIGINNATVTDILSGITDSDRVVVDGTDRLSEGAVVRVRKAGEMDNPPGYEPGRGGGKGGKGGKGGRGGKGGKSGKGEGKSQKDEGPGTGK